MREIPDFLPTVSMCNNRRIVLRLAFIHEYFVRISADFFYRAIPRTLADEVPIFPSLYLARGSCEETASRSKANERNSNRFKAKERKFSAASP